MLGASLPRAREKKRPTLIRGRLLCRRGNQRGQHARREPDRERQGKPGRRQQRAGKQDHDLKEEPV